MTAIAAPRPCRKHCYRSRFCAEIALVGIVLFGGIRRRECRAYPCTSCGRWHLTSSATWHRGAA